MRPKEGSVPRNRVTMFLKNHVIIRKTIAYAPAVILGGAALIERFTSHKLLPAFTLSNFAAVSLICGISGVVAGFDQTLENKKIERLN